MEMELLALWTESRKTVLFVTHDLEEALALADEVVVLSAGPASRVLNHYTVDLPRPRDLIDIRADARFNELYRHIWAQLREEVLASYAREEKASDRHLANRAWGSGDHGLADAGEREETR
jgi:NitT/TauT family transport system ATP-binding protein